VLSRSERAELARTMLHDVLTMLCGTQQLAGIVVVSGDSTVAKLAMLFDARVVVTSSKAASMRRSSRG